MFPLDLARIPITLLMVSESGSSMVRVSVEGENEEFLLASCIPSAPVNVSTWEGKSGGSALVMVVVVVIIASSLIDGN